MADADLIAQLYPFKDDHLLLYARNSLENSSRCMPPRLHRQQHQAAPQSDSSRETTEPPEDDNDPDTLPYLEVRFSHAPRTSSGLVFGTDENICDVVLPNIKGVSKRHFALTYKNQFADRCSRLIVRDLGSRHGTIVTYDGKGGKLRSNFDWILDGFRLPTRTKAFIVQLHENLMFRIVVARHDITSPAYANNVEQFHQGAANPQDVLRGLGLQSGPETERNTGTHTPVRQPILLPLGWIGKGGFGVVSRHWNVSTGEEFACKQPVDRKYDRGAWVKEINIMGGISHDNIVRLCFSRTSPSPLLYLEYMAFGNLEDEHSKAHFSHKECVTILHQSTSALKYLHGRSEPVAHRDIKPANILVQHRDPDRNLNVLHIKLSDFGLAKIGNSLKTGCGSETYCPPEVCASRSRQRYTKAVDIWSLGVVILRFAYALPCPGSGIGMGWCEKIVEEAQSWESEDLIDVLQRMLVIDAKARCSAADCWHEASRLLVSSQDRSTTPTPASYAAGYRAETARSISARQGGEVSIWQGEVQETINLPFEGIGGVPRDAPVTVPDLDWPSPSLDVEDYLDDDPDLLSGNQRFIRSNGPPPASARRISGSPRETFSGREIADADPSLATVINVAQCEDQEVVQYVWTDSEQYVAEALVGLNQMGPDQLEFTRPHALILGPSQQIPDLPPAIWPAEGGRTATYYPEGANGGSSAGDNVRSSPHPVYHEVEHAGPSHVPEELPDRQEATPVRRAYQEAPAELPSQIFNPVSEGSLTQILKWDDAPVSRMPAGFGGMAEFVGGLPHANIFASPPEPGQNPVVSSSRDKAAASYQSTRIDVPQTDDEIMPAFTNLPTTPAVEFWKLEYKGQVVMYMAHKGWINVTHLLQTYDRQKSLASALKHLNIQKEVVKGGRDYRQGTYVSFANAHRILRYLRIKSSAVDNLVGQVQMREFVNE